MMPSVPLQLACIVAMVISLGINWWITDAISVIFHEEPTDYLGDPEFNTAWCVLCRCPFAETNADTYRYNTLKMGTATIPLLTQLPWLARSATQLLCTVAMAHAKGPIGSSVPPWLDTSWNEQLPGESLMM